VAVAEFGQQPKRDKFSGLTRRAKRRKLAAEEDEERGDIGAISASVRAAKKTQRPVKIGEAQPKRQQAKKVAKRKKAAGRVTGASFERDLGQKGAREGVRARKGDVIAGIGKKKTGKVAERSKGAKKR
jgi:ATP-dependent RNA helicase DDX27